MLSFLKPGFEPVTKWCMQKQRILTKKVYSISLAFGARRGRVVCTNWLFSIIYVLSCYVGVAHAIDMTKKKMLCLLNAEKKSECCLFAVRIYPPMEQNRALRPSILYYSDHMKQERFFFVFSPRQYLHVANRSLERAFCRHQTSKQYCCDVKLFDNL